MIRSQKEVIMRVKSYYVALGISGFQTASVVLRVDDDITDEEIPFEQLDIEWSEVTVEVAEPLTIEEATDSDAEPAFIIKRQDGNIVVEQ